MKFIEIAQEKKRMKQLMIAVPAAVIALAITAGAARADCRDRGSVAACVKCVQESGNAGPNGGRTYCADAGKKRKQSAVQTKKL